MIVERMVPSEKDDLLNRAFHIARYQFASNYIYGKVIGVGCGCGYGACILADLTQRIKDLENLPVSALKEFFKLFLPQKAVGYYRKKKRLAIKRITNKNPEDIIPPADWRDIEFDELNPEKAPCFVCLCQK